MNYLESIADRIRVAVPEAKLPDGGVDKLFLLYAVLALAKGSSVTREDVHNAWVAWMTEQGAEHESMRPFHELPADVKDEDDPFVEAIRQSVAGSA